MAAYDLTLACDGEQRTLRASRRQGVDACSSLATTANCAAHVDGVQRSAAVCVHDGAHAAPGAATAPSSTSPSPRPTAADDAGADPRRARAPVAGVVAQVLVAAGDAVAAGQPLVCVEAMKMEMWLHAAAAGTVRAVHAAAGDSRWPRAPLLVELETRRTE